MIELTDDDREAIKLEMYAHDAPEALYLAGLAAGLERAAKVCETLHVSIDAYARAEATAESTVEQCAAAIRALGKP